MSRTKSIQRKSVLSFVNSDDSIQQYGNIVQSESWDFLEKITGKNNNMIS